MKIPNKLKIGGHIFKIDYSKELENENGKTEWKENTIYLCKTLPQDQKESTLIHEIIHCCNTSIGDTNSHHAIIDSLAEQLYQVFKDNNLLK